MKKNIIILGANKNAEFLSRLIDKDKCNIISFCSIYSTLVGKKIGDYIVESISVLDKYDFDYIVNIEENIIIENGDTRKVIEYSHLKDLTVFKSPEFSLMYSDYINYTEEYTGIITGISYVRSAIDENILSEKFIKLAAPCQDLFYDFEMFKLVTSKKECQLKYCIIGLTLYSFNYDLSLSKANKDRAIYYYPIIKTMHNYEDTNNIKGFINDFNTKSKEVFIDNSQYRLFDKYKEYFRSILNKSENKTFKSQDVSKNELVEKIDYMDREFNKVHPATVDENIEIFKNYLTMVNSKNIKALVVLPPISSFYRGYVKQESVNAFLNIINQMEAKYSFDFINFWDDDILTDEYYTDGFHLNKKGAKVITEKINEYIFI